MSDIFVSSELCLKSFLACEREEARKLLEQVEKPQLLTDNHGKTLLHWAAHWGWPDTVKLLVEHYHCDPKVRSNDGTIPLHDACVSSCLETIQYLIEYCNPMCKNFHGNAPLHFACDFEGSSSLDVIRFLIEECKCDPMCKRNNRQTPLHLACARGHVNVVMYLILQCKCDPMCKDLYENTPLHLACGFEGSSSLDVIRFLIEECKCDPMYKGNLEQTPLHLACTSGHVDVVKYLITRCKCNLMFRDKYLRSLFYQACENCNYAVVEYLLCAGDVNPTSINSLLPAKKIFEREDDMLKLLFQKFSLLKSCRFVHSYGNIFLLGDPGVGKSTLTEVIKKRANSRFLFGQYRQVSGVEFHTAGIIPHRLEHRELGNIILHDLAGQPEYYSSHIAVLENITQRSAAVFIIVVKLSEDAPYRWLSLVKDLSSRCSGVCYVLTVASHADAVEGEVRRQELAQGLEGKISSCIKGEGSRLQSMGVVYLDCRKLDSEQFNVFKGFLSVACQSVKRDSSLKNTEPQTVMYCRMLYLLMETKGDNVYEIDTLRKMVRESNYYLPETEDNLLLTLYSLHCVGLIMFINTPGGSWVVFRKQVLLAEVNGKIFAPKTFHGFKNVASNTGIVSRKTLCENFKHYDPEMLVEFLLSMKLCDEITPEMMEMTNLSPKDTDNAESELLFFPALMSYYKRPVMSSQVCSDEPLEENDTVLNEPFQFGWCLQSSDRHGFFSPRFLHLLILHLAYQYALPKTPCNPHDLRCTIWSTGILWNNEYGVKTLVELVDNSQSVILLMSSKEGMNHNMVPLRREVIIDVLSIKEKTCPSVQAKEYIIDSPQLDYPVHELSSLVLYDIEGIASCIALNKPCAVSYNRDSQGEHVNTKLCDLLPLEYGIGQDISIFAGRDIKTLKLPGGRMLPNTVLSSPTEVLKKHSAAIQGVVSDPIQLATNLYSAELISFSVKDEVVTTTGLSRYKKANIVMNEVERNMSGTNVMEKFKRLCAVLKEQRNTTITEIVMEMEKDFGTSHDQ